MVWKMDRTGMMTPESQRGMRESRTPSTRPAAKPMTTDTTTNTECTPMAFSSSAP